MTVLFPGMENRSEENQPFVETCSELIFTQLESSRSFLIKEYKKDILDIFDGNVKIGFLCSYVIGLFQMH